MMIAPKLDAGDMLLQESTLISDEDTAETLHDRLSAMGARLILPTLEGLRSGTVVPRVQDETRVTYAKKLVKEMERLDWSASVRQVDLQVRGLQPWPGTRIETEGGLRIKIKKGRPADVSVGGAAGNLQEHFGRLVLKCGEGAYEILELQEEGKKSVTSGEFLNGMKGRGLTLPMVLKGTSV